MKLLEKNDQFFRNEEKNLCPTYDLQMSVKTP